MANNPYLSRTIRRSRTCRGFTLTDTLVASVIMGLLLAGGINLYVSSLRIASRSNAQVSATDRAAIIAEQIADLSRESYSFALPTDSSGFVIPVAGKTTSDFITADGNAAALQLTFPVMASIAVVNSAGATCTAAAGTNFPLIYTKVAGNVLTIYRSDNAGNPSKDTGQYLWEKGTLADGTSVSNRFAKLGETAAVSASIADAATFVRATGSTTAVEIQIIAGDYSIIGVNGQQDSSGNVTQTVGKWALSRDHP